MSYKNKVYDEIKLAIINRDLMPGEQLNERKLAEKLGISRTPIREALQMLESDGWVITEPWKGTYVRDITEQDVEEVFQVRLALETLVIELIVPQMNAAALQRLDELFAIQSEESTDWHPSKFIAVDRQFHQYLATLTGNSRLVQILDASGDIVRRLGVQALATNERYQETLQEHENIIRALKANDFSKARQAMIYHVLRTKETIYKYWNNPMKR